MTLDKIYYELSLGKSVEYYVKLAEDEVMLIPVLIESIHNDSSYIGKWSQNILEEISKKYPEKVYPFYSYIIKDIESERRTIALGCVKILAILTAVDTDNMWERVSKNFYELLESDIVIEFLIACSCAEILIENKPDECGKIMSALADAGKREYKTDSGLCEYFNQTALEKTEFLLQKIMEL